MCVHWNQFGSMITVTSIYPSIYLSTYLLSIIIYLSIIYQKSFYLCISVWKQTMWQQLLESLVFSSESWVIFSWKGALAFSKIYQVKKGFDLIFEDGVNLLLCFKHLKTCCKVAFQRQLNIKFSLQYSYLIVIGCVVLLISSRITMLLCLAFTGIFRLLSKDALLVNV